MPRKIDPSSLTVGGGLSASKSVDATSFVNPTQGLDSLIAHVVDPSRAHEARAINLLDAGGYYVSDNVEGALQEIASSGAYTGQSGVYQGCTFTATGLSATIDASSVVVLEGTGRDISGEAFVLPNNVTCWVYVLASTGAVTVLSGATAPSMTSPENILLWKVVTSGGLVTSRVDVRLFVRNIHRKVSLIVRSSGTAADRNSEACFESLDGAMEYLAQYGPSGVMRSAEVVIRGDHTVQESLTVPIDGVTIRGEAGCVLSTGSIMNPMFDVSGRSRVTFRDLTFSCESTSSVVIGSTTTCSDVLVDRCTIVSGAENWQAGVMMLGTQSRFVMRNCTVEADEHAVYLEEPSSCKISHVEATSAGPGPIVGFLVGTSAPATARNCVVSDVVVNGFPTGVSVDCPKTRLSNVEVNGAAYGLVLESMSADSILTGIDVTLDSSTGLVGVDVQCDDVKISSSFIRNDRTVYTVETPIGVQIYSGASGVCLTDVAITDFVNATASAGYGISFDGSSTACVVSGCTLDEVDVGISFGGTASSSRITATSVSGARIGLFLVGQVFVSGSDVSLSATRGVTGIYGTGTGLRLIGCSVATTRVSYGSLQEPTGIYLTGCVGGLVSDCSVTGFYNSVDSLGNGISVVSSSTDLTISKTTISECQVGIDLADADGTSVLGCSLSAFAIGIQSASHFVSITDTNMSASATIGELGITLSGNSCTVQGGSVTTPRVTYTSEVPVGITISGDEAKILGVRISDWTNSDGAGVMVSSPAINAEVSDCLISGCWYGVLSEAGASTAGLRVSDTKFSSMGLTGVRVFEASRLLVSGCSFNSGGAEAIYVEDAVDVQVSGCVVDGDDTITYGVRVVGTLADRSRRVVISGNTMSRVTAGGVSLEGYVQNVVVGDNQIDCGLSSGDPTATAGIALLSSGTALVRYATVTGNTIWRAQSGIVVTGVSLVAFAREVSITDNVIHHCALGTGSTTRCSGVDLQWVSGVAVTDNVIYQIGLLISDSDVVSSPVSGANVYPIGVYASQCEGIKVDGNRISDLLAAGTGTSCGVLFEYVTLGALLDLRSASISNNRLLTSDVVSPMTSGIQVTLGQTSGLGNSVTMTGLSVSNNLVRRVLNQGVLVTVSGGAALLNALIHGNVVTQCTSTTSGYGILVDVVASSTFNDGIVRSLVVSDNNVSDAGESGIALLFDEGCSVTGAVFSGNDLRNLSYRGIEITGATPNSLNAISVLNNTVRGATSEGIYVVSSDSDVMNVQVIGNTVTGLNGAPSSNSGIIVTVGYVAVNQNDLYQLSVRSNNIYCGGGVGIGIQTNGILVDADVSSNVISMTGGTAPISVRLGSGSTVLSEVFSDSVRITNNILRGGTSSTITVDGGQKIRNFSFSENEVSSTSSYGLVFTITEATTGSSDSVSNLKVDDNDFSSTVDAAILLRIGIALVIDFASNVSVSRNKFRSCVTTGLSNNVILISTFARVTNLACSHNTFKSCGAVDSASIGIIELQTGSSTNQSAYDVAFDSNVMEDCTGVGIYVTSNATATASGLYSLSASSNTFKDLTNDAIRINTTTMGAINGIRVFGNVIDDVSGAASDAGVVFVGPSSSSVDVESLVITGNTITSALGGGILVSAVDLEGLKICDNSVKTTTGGADGIRVTVTRAIDNGSVCGNTVELVDGDGIEVESTATVAGTAGIYNTSISGNVISSPGDSGIHVIVDDATATGILLNVRVCENTIEGPGLQGIFLHMQNGSYGEVVSVDGNTISGPSENGIYVLYADGGTVVSNLSVSQNRLTDVGEHGIFISNTNANSSTSLIATSVCGNVLTDVQYSGIMLQIIAVFGSGLMNNLSISDNVVRNWSLDASTTQLYGAVDIINAGTQNLVISANSMRTNQPYSTGIYLRCAGTSRTMTVADNVLHMESATNTTSLLFDPSASADQLNLSFTGNNFRGAATGVSYLGSFAPQYSVVANNVERTSAGAGAWSTFVAPFTNSITTPNQD